MNKMRILMILCIVGITTIVNAQQRVNEREVKNAAINTLHRKSEMLKVSSDTVIKTVNSFRNANGDTLMYEVVFETGAAILLSGDKACQPILGYYLKGKEDRGSVFDKNNINVPPGLRALLNDYAQMIELGHTRDSMGLAHEDKWNELQQSPLRKSNSPVGPYIGPLLTTKWGQSNSNDGHCDAYNYYVTGTDNGCSCNSERCPVGCAAVAMGQIMKHWNYPVYWFNTGAQYYDWCNMPDTLCYQLPPYYNTLNPNYEKERHAIARLLKDCGDAANSTYCVLWTCNTSALLANARTAFVNDFGYSNSADRRDRSSYNDTKWKNFIKEDLDNGRPVMYGSLGTSADGHYWVLDGYDSDDQFHFNWGWRGSSWDGWYTLNEIKDIDGSNYRWSQRAIFKIYPATNQDYCNYDMSLYDYYVSKLALIMIYIYNGFSVPPEIWNAIHAGIPKFATTLTSVNPDLYPNSSFPIPEEWHTIKAGQTVEYVAHESIRLLPGFKVEAGATFSARIEPCANCNSAKITMKSLVNGEEVEEELYIAVGDSEEESPMGERETVAYEPQVYPNPTTGLLTIDAKNNNSRIQMIELYNTQGSKLFTFSGNDGFFQEIDISHLPSQVYVLKIQVNGQVFTKKLILQK